METPFIMVNPQWQGGGNPVTSDGAKELEKLYLSGVDFKEVSVSLNDGLLPVNGIVGYEDIDRQMKLAAQLLKDNSARTIVSVGGGCDADVPVIAYLNEFYGGNLLVLWFDAHGDLNTPTESQTGLFYGMPGRILMGESGLFTDIIERPLKPRQFVHIGGRDFDEAELRYLQRNDLCRIPCGNLNAMKHVLNERRACHIYIHLDLDVLSPDEFPNTPLPVSGGVSKPVLLDLLSDIQQKYPLIGLGLYEYAPCGEKSAFIESIFDIMLFYRKGGVA